MRESLNKLISFLKIFLILIFGLGILFYPREQAKALEWYEYLIPDWAFVNKNSMSLAQIQNFLASKGSALANYSWNSKSAASWIYDEAQEHGINPQVILVTLQKEQSLITSASPTQTALDCAMGYGAAGGCQWMFENYPEYRGFGNQVGGAAYMMRYNFDLGRGPCSYYVGQTAISCIITRSWESGFTNVYLSNKATAVLYRYTPYIYNGNYNFYTLYRNWFGWSAYIVKTEISPAIYLVYDDVKYHIQDPQSFSALGFSWGNVNLISESALNNYSNGPPLSYLIKGSGQAIYLGNDGYKYHIPNPTTFSNFGFRWEQMSFPGDSLINSIPYNGSLNNLIKGRGPEIYAMDQGVKRHIKDLDTFNHFRFKWDSISFLSDEFIGIIPSSSFISRLVKGSGEKIYFMENGQRRWITSMLVFKKKGFRWEDIGQVSDGLLNSYPEGKPLY